MVDVFYLRKKLDVDAIFEEKNVIHMLQFYPFLSHLHNDDWDWAVLNIKQS